MKKIKKTKTKKSIENMIIYTDPDYPLDASNIFHTYGFYKSSSHFEKLNDGMLSLIIIPKCNLPKSKRIKKRLTI